MKREYTTVDVFYNKCHRKIFQMQWKYHVNTEELLERVSMKSLSEDAKFRRFKTICQILRQDRSND